jgi:glycosyltransferase involved in cell wall biosynthesis
VITFVNRNLEPYRGYHTMMRALPELLMQRPDAHVVIVGGSDVSYGSRAPEGQSWREIYSVEVRSQISDANWSRVHFVGKVPYAQFLRLLQVSSVHLYLTYPFVLSWSLLEAMSAGCAIVASNTQPVREVIAHGETGLLVDFFSPAQVTESICALLENADARARLGGRARDFARSHYDLASICLPRQLDWVQALG